MSICRNQWHFCTQIMKYQKEELGGEIPFTVAIRKIRNIGLNLTKVVKDLDLENQRTLKKEIKDDTN